MVSLSLKDVRATDALGHVSLGRAKKALEGEVGEPEGTGGTARK
jgi:hypothetical protein